MCVPCVFHVCSTCVPPSPPPLAPTTRCLPPLAHLCPPSRLQGHHRHHARLRFTPLAPAVCSLTYIIQVSLGGRIPLLPNEANAAPGQNDARQVRAQPARSRPRDARGVPAPAEPRPAERRGAAHLQQLRAARRRGLVGASLTPLPLRHHAHQARAGARHRAFPRFWQSRCHHRLFAAAYWFIFESRESTQISNSRATLLAWW